MTGKEKKRNRKRKEGDRDGRRERSERRRGETAEGGRMRTVCSYGACSLSFKVIPQITAESG